MDGKGFLSYRLPCKWGAVLSTVISNNCNYYGNEPAGPDAPPPTRSPKPCELDFGAWHLQTEWEWRGQSSYKKDSQDHM